MKRDYDVLVIGGGGSAGFTAATTAMKTGAKVAMVEGGRLGGLCILAGCMPSKTLLWAAAKRFAGGGESHAEAVDRKRLVVDYLAGNRVASVEAKRNQGLVVLNGLAEFADEHAVTVDGRRVSAESIVVATGSREFIPNLPGLKETGCLLSDDFLDLPALPESLIVLGGGAVALELAQYAARMGSRVTLLQRSEHVLSKEEPAVGQAMERALAKEGIRVITGAQARRVESDGLSKSVYFTHQGHETSLKTDEILLAMGRAPAVDGLKLDAAGIDLKREALAVDQAMRTNRPHIFAAGDVTGVNMVVNLAIVQGEVAGHNAATGESRQVDDRVIPQAVFTDPQFARVGLGRTQAQAAGIEFLEATQKLDEMGVARTYPELPQGFCTLRAEKKSGRLIGAEIVAPEASLLIHDTAVAMKLNGTAQDLADLAYVHPCLSELTNLAAIRLAAKVKKG